MDYQKQASDFLSATETTFEAKFIENNFYFDGDKEKRDIYQITLTRLGRKFVFKFGQSIHHSGEWIVKDKIPKLTKTFGDKREASEYGQRINGRLFSAQKNPNQQTPKPYDVLACLQKYDPGSFDNFCSEFGYDTDSRNAFKTYKAVKREFKNLERLFSPEQMEQLQEIN